MAGTTIYSAVFDYLCGQYPHLTVNQIHSLTNTIDQYIVDQIPQLVAEEMPEVDTDIQCCDLCHTTANLLARLEDEIPEDGECTYVCESCFEHNS